MPSLTSSIKIVTLPKKNNLNFYTNKSQLTSTSSFLTASLMETHLMPLIFGWVMKTLFLPFIKTPMRIFIPPLLEKNILHFCHLSVFCPCLNRSMYLGNGSWLRTQKWPSQFQQKKGSYRQRGGSLPILIVRRTTKYFQKCRGLKIGMSTWFWKLGKLCIYLLCGTIRFLKLIGKGILIRSQWIAGTTWASDTSIRSIRRLVKSEDSCELDIIYLKINREWFGKCDITFFVWSFFFDWIFILSFRLESRPSRLLSPVSP